MRILRIYLDGAYGTGKSTTARVMALGGALYVPEPMAYWRTLFDTDTVAGIYDAQTRKQNGSLSEEDAALVTAQHQAAFATPYLLLHTRLVPLFGPAVEGPPEMTVVFDRHPVAATVCFPLARFIVGDISAAAFVGLAATLPGEPPAATWWWPRWTRTSTCGACAPARAPGSTWTRACSRPCATSTPCWSTRRAT